MTGMSAVEVVYAVLAGCGIAVFVIGVGVLVRNYRHPGPSSDAEFDAPSKPISPRSPKAADESD